MKRNDHVESYQRLQHILLSLEKIDAFIKGESKKSFHEDQKLQCAVLLQFIIIGEAIIHVEITKLIKYDYPWHKVRSFRNLIAHEYFQIKMDAVWEIIISDVPDLKTVIMKILENEF